MTDTLPPYVPKALVAERLPQILPEGTPNRSYCTRDLAVSAVFTLLYVGAVDGAERLLAPVHVYRMTEEQAANGADEARFTYAAGALRRNFAAPGRRWYADNTREPIRDETLREGLVAIGAVTTRTDIPTTSSRPRYALERGFAALFDPALCGDALTAAIAAWQETRLSKAALGRILLLRRGAAGSGAGMLVTFPNGETRRLASGPSSAISQAVIELFAPRFLETPAVLWLSESGNKVVQRDDTLARALGLEIDMSRDLPDIILVDTESMLVVFVEVVATDGPVTERRRDALLKLTDAAGFARTHVAFLTAYRDRDGAACRKSLASVAWGSFVWFVSEPDRLMVLHDGVARLSTLRANLGTVS